MNHHDVFINHTFDPELAIQYGFTKQKDEYEFRKEIGIDQLLAVIQITEITFKSKVLDPVTAEEYLLYHIDSSEGAYVNRVRSRMNQLITEIVEECFKSNHLRQELLNYVRNKYNTVAEEPWDQFEGYQTLKTNRTHKWYGLLITVPYEVLKKGTTGRVDILNVKAKPEEVESLIDHKRYFPAYHMNKKHWLTVLLDQSADSDEIKQLIDQSYQLVDK